MSRPLTREDLFDILGGYEDRFSRLERGLRTTTENARANSSQVVQGGLNAWYYPDAGSGQVLPSYAEILTSYDWTDRSVPNTGLTNWTMVAEGYIKFPVVGGTWTIYALSDDGVQLRVSGSVVTAWIGQAATEYNVTVTTSAGTENALRPFSVAHYQGTGTERFRLQWENVAAGYPKQAIPASAFYYEEPRWLPWGLPTAYGGPNFQGLAPYVNSRNYGWNYPVMSRKIGSRVEMKGLIVLNAGPPVSILNLPLGYRSPDIHERIFWGQANGTNDIDLRLRQHDLYFQAGAVGAGAWVPVANLVYHAH